MVKKNDIMEDEIFDDSADAIMIDMSEVEDAPGFELLPNGWYLLDITDDNERVIKNEGGKIPVGVKGVNFTFTVVEGPYENRKVWDGFWWHASSYPYLKALMKASGAFEGRMNESLSAEEIVQDLSGARVWGKVTIKKGKGDYPDQNQIREYKAENERTSASDAKGMFD